MTPTIVLCECIVQQRYLFFVKLCFDNIMSIIMKVSYMKNNNGKYYTLNNMIEKISILYQVLRHVKYVENLIVKTRWHVLYNYVKTWNLIFATDSIQFSSVLNLVIMPRELLYHHISMFYIFFFLKI